MLHILRSDYFLSEYLLEEADLTAGIEVSVHRRSAVRIPFSALRRLSESLSLCGRRSTRFFDSEYIERLSRIGRDDKVLFFDVQNLKDLVILRKFIAAHDVSVFLWNPTSSFCRSAVSRATYAARLRRAGYRVFTFDRDDAARYGFELTEQVYRPDFSLVSPDVVPDTDLFFVGKDKGRLRVLSDIRSMAEAAGLRCKMHVVRDKHTSCPEPETEKDLTDSDMPYAETLRWVGRSRCLIEVLQKGQSGHTLRVMEALFYGKKLLTNNPDIVTEPYYDPQRVFIFGKDDPASLREFVERPVDPAADMSRWRQSPYHIARWIETFRGGGRPIAEKECPAGGGRSAAENME